MYPSFFRHSYVQLQMVRSQRYQLYVLYCNTASNAQFMSYHLLYCIVLYLGINFVEELLLFTSKFIGLMWKWNEQMHAVIFMLYHVIHNRIHCRYQHLSLHKFFWSTFSFCANFSIVCFLQMTIFVFICIYKI